MRRLICIFIILSVLSLPVSAEYPTHLTPVGNAVALELRTDGVYLVGFSQEQTPAQEAGLKEGDRIVSVNSAQVHNPKELGEMIRQAQGETLFIKILRDGKQMSFTVLPECSSGKWQIGVLVRDTIRGIGTVTFYDPQTGLFGALGHGVNDTIDKKPLTILQGSASRTQVTGVIRGQKGKPGALCGIDMAGELFGSVEQNTASGVFGHLKKPPLLSEPLPLASAEEVRTGEAEILCNVRGSSTEHYRVEIERIDADAENGRNLLLHVLDAKLLAQTGGIVQGMSGSPILQDGKLIGAVTHVLVKDPTEGYGILIENMLNAAQEYAAA